MSIAFSFCMRCRPGRRAAYLMQRACAGCGLSKGCIYARSICMYHMHDSFGKRTEVLMHDLAGAATGALQMSSGILDALDGMDAKMAGKTHTYRHSLRSTAGKPCLRCAGARVTKESIAGRGFCC